MAAVATPVLTAAGGVSEGVLGVPAWTRGYVDVAPEGIGLCHRAWRRGRFRGVRLGILGRAWRRRIGVCRAAGKKSEDDEGGEVSHGCDRVRASVITQSELSTRYSKWFSYSGEPSSSHQSSEGVIRLEYLDPGRRPLGP